jgi:hypothetical protein
MQFSSQFSKFDISLYEVLGELLDENIILCLYALPKHPEIALFPHASKVFPWHSSRHGCYEFFPSKGHEQWDALTSLEKREGLLVTQVHASPLENESVKGMVNLTTIRPHRNEYLLCRHQQTHEGRTINGLVMGYPYKINGRQLEFGNLPAFMLISERDVRDGYGFPGWQVG